MNIYIAHYHFEEISSALNALSVHLKQKWFEETFKRVQIKCVIIQVRREIVPCWRASKRESPSASCRKSVTRNGKFSTDIIIRTTTTTTTNTTTTTTPTTKTSTVTVTTTITTKLSTHNYNHNNNDNYNYSYYYCYKKNMTTIITTMTITSQQLLPPLTGQSVLNNKVWIQSKKILHSISISRIYLRRFASSNTKPQQFISQHVTFHHLDNK